MPMKISRWEGLYPRIQSAAKHIRCGFVCGYRKIAGPFRSERSAIIGAAQPGVHGPEPSDSRSCAECDVTSPLGRGSHGTSAQGGASARAVSSHGSQASCAACAQNANGLASSSARPKASNDGTALRLIEICSASPSTARLCMISMSRPGRRAIARVVPVSAAPSSPSRVVPLNSCTFRLHFSVDRMQRSCPRT